VLHTLRTQLDAFRTAAGDRPWAIAWAAGAGTVASDAQGLRRESETLAGFVGLLAEHAPQGPGAFMLASSAGGLYAGSSSPPFRDSDPPAPIGTYGIEKLRQEQAATTAFASRLPVVLVRFSNVYGAGQNLAKSQGLVSRLALAAVSRQPVNLFVPLDTIRDYIEADDAAGAAAHWLRAAVHRAEAMGSTGAAGAEVRVIASGRATTVAELIGIASDIARRRIPVALGTDASAQLQAPDLRFIPSRAAGIVFPQTPLPVGIKRVIDAVLRQQQVRAPLVVG
jgi:UDP-glucose 4-epimerase